MYAADLAVNEFIPLGIQRIEAVYKSRLPDMSRAPVQGVVVAVVDTGVDASHPDLNVVGGMNFVSDEPGLTYANDTNGHGTHVSGEKVCTAAGLWLMHRDYFHPALQTKMATLLHVLSSTVQ
jgi:hypothetical protein